MLGMVGEWWIAKTADVLCSGKLGIRSCTLRPTVEVENRGPGYPVDVVWMGSVLETRSRRVCPA